ncbi:MAG: flagellar basal body rod protein FlgB [Treponema sp.]|nr:flagellar basal body rod protein FlgB [Treponema sp.]
MIVDNNFSKTIDLLHRSMSASTLRHAVYADNLANADVPNFRRTEVTFESQLGRSLNSQANRPALLLTQTHPNHVSNWQPMDHQDVLPRRVLDFATQTQNNGSNVDAEEEVNLLLKNQLRYTLATQMANFEFSQVSMILRG